MKKNALYLKKGFCSQCAVRKIPGNEKYDCLILVSEITGTKIDCRNNINLHFGNSGLEKIEQIKKNRF